MQILDNEIDQCCTSLLQDLVRFQDMMYHKDPVKAKTKRRIVLGLREVTKHLKLKKIKCVVISPNLEKIQSKGGLDEALNNILNMCQEQTVPFVFALGRRALGRACAKLVPVSVVGIFNYEGCESKYHSLISLTAAARAAYDEMVLAVEKEVAEYPTMASQTSSIGGVPGLFAAHMGHSRTPSGCSAISFTSSILSEPISENFPHAEPEVDSKGYEIVRDAAGNVVHPSGGGSRLGGAGSVHLSGGGPTLKAGGAGNDFDDGNEADIEDFGETRRKKRGGRNLNSVRFGDMGGVESDVDGGALGKEDLDRHRIEGQENGGVDSNDSAGQLSRNVSESTLTNEDLGNRRGKHKLGDSFDEVGQFEEESDDGEQGSKWSSVGHIDSIHSDTYNLGHEILSQHTVLPQDQRSRGQGQSVRLSQLSPSSLSAVCGSEARRVGMGAHHGDGEDDEDDDDVGVDDYVDGDEDGGREDDEVEEEAAKPHHRIIDKERIKNWLESQTNITTED
ncbi:unnamed protein product [Lymnaea stagnalis]|uniref:Ribosomal protein eL8/eL30/eS12/Gadd45 domain-containing protein n=1 Tax=Lymnaea stagnalis TaxID=6523 RepID=A0AAV2H407_LYMST